MGQHITHNDLSSFGPVLMPEDSAEPILSRPVRSALLDWLMEVWASEELKAVGLTPRKRAIFHGAPGTGKSTLAHHLAARLGLPMLKVRSEKLKSQWIGETGVFIGKMFDMLQQVGHPIFLFFDEFDSLAGKRMGSGKNEVGEQDHNHGINVLLANLDRYDGFMVAATNYGNLIDEAIWRRFEIQISIDVPGDKERREILKRYLAPFVLPPIAIERLSASFASASPALIRQACEHIKRQIIIGPKADWKMDREAVISRLIDSVQPHPDLGKPRLWSQGVEDFAIKTLPWPLEQSLDAYPAPAETGVLPEPGAVVPLRRKGGEK
jgi:hypothetical protein